MVSLSEKITGAFPWIVSSCVMAGILYPPLMTWFQGPLLPLGLGLIMLGMGLTLKMEDFLHVIHYPKWIGLGLVLQFTVMPLLGWGLAKLFQLPPFFAVGMILVASCPGGTASNVIAYLARANVALSVSMTAFSTLGAVVMTPFLTLQLSGSYLDVSALSAAEDKWKLQNGLVLLLPHGYEGQGAEHSSARMERYLQLCAKDNMFVANCTSPANMFHLLRRQMKTNYRKPLVVFTPKSLLRHPQAVSQKKEFTHGQFQPILSDTVVNKKEVTSIVFCSGKFYYDLYKFREEHNRFDVALIRLEQLFPLPVADIESELKKYPNAKEKVWAQEEPRNMGAWSYLLLQYPEASQFRPATRRYYGAPAAGSATRYLRRHQQVIDYVFDPTKDNFIQQAKK